MGREKAKLRAPLQFSVFNLRVDAFKQGCEVCNKWVHFINYFNSASVFCHIYLKNYITIGKSYSTILKVCHINRL
jgi:hypothetical protein